MTATILSSFLQTVYRHPDVIALRRKRDGTWLEWSYQEYADRVASVVTWLGENGVRHAEHVALLLDNCVEFHVADMAVQFAGATPVSLYNTAPPEQLQYVLGHADVSLLIASDRQFDVVLELLVQRPDMRVVFVGDTPRSGFASWRDLESEPPSDLERCADLVTPDSIATIIYTSGTTGLPKGVMLSQRNVLHTARAYLDRADFEVVGQRMVSYLPMAHIAERVVTHYAAVYGGQTITPCPSVSQLGEYLVEVRPQAIFGVPLIWERLHNRILDGVRDRATVALTMRGVDRLAGLPVPGVRTLGKSLRRRIGKKVLDRAGLGDLRYAAAGGAATDPSLIVWFRALGMPLTEAYGMSESTGPMSFDPTRFRPGASGRPLDGVEVRIAKDDEILCKGPTVFSGYLHDEARTIEVLRDGWLHTGDLGKLDRRGFLYVVGRKKDLIVTSGGENVSPSNLEAHLTANPIIANACVAGDDRPYLVSLLVLDEKVARRWFAEQQLAFTSLSAAARNERLVGEIARIIDRINADVSRAEQIRRFVVLDHTWDGDAELMTLTMKPKRPNVIARYRAQIDALYEG